MTRKEALDRLYAILTHSKDRQNVNATEVAFLLRDIYDEFEKQCESCKFFGSDNGESWEEGYSQCVKERVCKNCKYGEYRPVGLICTNEKEVMTTYMCFVDEDFGCNRFERRENVN